MTKAKNLVTPKKTNVTFLKLCFALGLFTNLGNSVNAEESARQVCDLKQFEFDGKVEPFKRQIASTRIDGILSEIHVERGSRVEAGQALFSIEPRRFEIAVQIAEAERDQAAAAAAQAKSIADRKKALLQRDAGSLAQAEEFAFDSDIAQAALAQAEAELLRAQLDLENTIIRAEISGVVSAINVSIGQFLEAKGDTELGEITQINPARIRYEVPHQIRQDAMRTTGATSVNELFDRVEFKVIEPSGAEYPHMGKAEFESVRVNSDTGQLSTWGQVANPKGILVPGLHVTVVSSIKSNSVDGQYSNPAQCKSH